MTFMAFLTTRGDTNKKRHGVSCLWNNCTFLSYTPFLSSVFELIGQKQKNIVFFLQENDSRTTYMTICFRWLEMVIGTIQYTHTMLT